MRVRVVLAAALLLAMLPGCREQEQNRRTDYQAGVYKGDKPPELSEDQRRELRERANNMR